MEQEQRTHRHREQKQEDEQRERQEALIDAVRSYSRTARELYSRLLQYQYHHTDEDTEQALRKALYEATIGVEKQHTISFLAQYLQDYFQHTLPPKRAKQRAGLRFPSPSSLTQEHPSEET